MNTRLGGNAPSLERATTAEPTDRDRLVGEVARMLAQWERGDELHGEFAGRLVDYVVKNLKISEANCRH